MKKIVFEVSIVRNGGVITPTELGELCRKFPDGGEFVAIISGRLPVWAFAAVCHKFHPTLAVGCFDPRLGGAVCVASHTPDFKVGDLIPTDGAEVIKIEF